MVSKEKCYMIEIEEILTLKGLECKKYIIGLTAIVQALKISPTSTHCNEVL